MGLEITERIIKDIDQTILRIKNSPEQFPVVIKRRRIHLCVAFAQTSIFLKVDLDHIEILSIFSNRRSPKKRKL